MSATNDHDAARTRSVVSPAWLLSVLKAITAISIFAIAFLTFSDVIMRYFFNSPLRGIYEIDGLLLGLLTMSALPLVTEQRAHITVEVFDNYIRGNARFVMQLIILIFQGVMIGFITWRLYAIALREWNNGWVTIDLQISRAPLLFTLAALGLLTTVFVIIMIVQFCRRRLPVIPVGGVSQSTDDVL